MNDWAHITYKHNGVEYNPVLSNYIKTKEEIEIDLYHIKTICETHQKKLDEIKINQVLTEYQDIQKIKISHDFSFEMIYDD